MAATKISELNRKIEVMLLENGVDRSVVQQEITTLNLTSVNDLLEPGLCIYRESEIEELFRQRDEALVKNNEFEAERDKTIAAVGEITKLIVFNEDGTPNLLAMAPMLTQGFPPDLLKKVEFLKKYAEAAKPKIINIG